MLSLVRLEPRGRRREHRNRSRDGDDGRQVPKRAVIAHLARAHGRDLGRRPQSAVERVLPRDEAGEEAADALVELVLREN